MKQGVSAKHNEINKGHDDDKEFEIEQSLTKSKLRGMKSFKTCVAPDELIVTETDKSKSLTVITLKQ